jgi:GT2 family glycosyltransferase
MPDPRVTIVVVPRERFSASRASLESLYEHTQPGFELVYVDGGSPPLVKSYLEREASKRGFALVRTERYLSPNRARNLGFASVTTEYVVFIDNDVLVTPGWLDHLVRCADETGAWVVGPLYLMGAIERRFVHMAGGIVTVSEAGGRRVLHEHHRYPHTALASIPRPLTREPVDLVEFHCMLVQAATLRRLGRLDEQLLSAPEHIDLCMAVRAAGGQVYFEPAAMVSYVPPPPFHRSDLPFFLLRWSDAWNASSLRHFNQKWHVDIQPEYADWLTSHRRTVLEPVHQLVHRLLGWRRGTWVEKRVVHPIEALVNDWVVRRYGC